MSKGNVAFQYNIRPITVITYLYSFLGYYVSQVHFLDALKYESVLFTMA